MQPATGGMRESAPLRWTGFLQSPIILLLLAVGLLSFLVQSGELGTSDAEHRLQVAHSWWTGEPEVLPDEYPEFGIHGKNGKLYAWYGMGQSLLMLPFDLAGSQVEKVPIFRPYDASGSDPAVRIIFVSFCVNVLLGVLTALVAFLSLRRLDFDDFQAVVGTLGLICGTTHLHYTQNMQENNLIFLLTLTGLFFQLRWVLEEVDADGPSAGRKHLVFGTIALGLNLLVRLTTALDILIAAVMVGTLLWRKGLLKSPANSTKYAHRYLSATMPVYLVFLLIDRIYQRARFASWTNTYVSLFGDEQRRLNPSLPANFPFNGHWFQGGTTSGILGPLLSPNKSIFLFDPLLILALLVLPFLWTRLSLPIRCFTAATLLLVTAYVTFYGNYYWWAGDFSWGDRYVSTAVELACLIAVPLLAKYWRVLPVGMRWTGPFLVAFSVAIQLASVAFWLPLEIYQIPALHHPSCVPWMRFQNILAQTVTQLTGNNPSWAIAIPPIPDQWDLKHITTWNLFPSLMEHLGGVSAATARALGAIWLIVLLALVLTVGRLFLVLRRNRV